MNVETHESSSLSGRLFHYFSIIGLKYENGLQLSQGHNSNSQSKGKEKFIIYVFLLIYVSFLHEYLFSRFLIIQ